jgi:hypothetical protein
MFSRDLVTITHQSGSSSRAQIAHYWRPVAARTTT